MFRVVSVWYVHKSRVQRKDVEEEKGEGIKVRPVDKRALLVEGWLL